mgnify:CR=1 FL=1
MKILCQEHYDKVVKYAKEIGDTSLDNCLKRLNSGRTIATARVK